MKQKKEKKKEEKNEFIFFTSAVSFVVLNGLTVVMKAPMKDRCREKQCTFYAHFYVHSSKRKQ